MYEVPNLIKAPSASRFPRRPPPLGSSMNKGWEAMKRVGTTAFQLFTIPAVYRLLLLFGEPLNIARTFSCRVFYAALSPTLRVFISATTSATISARSWSLPRPWTERREFTPTSL
jgi:hypothetical protein